MCSRKKASDCACVVTSHRGQRTGKKCIFQSWKRRISRKFHAGKSKFKLPYETKSNTKYLTSKLSLTNSQRTNNNFSTEQGGKNYLQKPPHYSPTTYHFQEISISFPYLYGSSLYHVAKLRSTFQIYSDFIVNFLPRKNTSVAYLSKILPVLLMMS